LSQSVGVHGADTIQQCLNAGLLDEIHVDIAAVLLGSGSPGGTPLALGVGWNPLHVRDIGGAD
jgi:hypothetical protein